MNKAINSITISIPAFNEQATIESVAKSALSELKKVTLDYELLLINDGSYDKTGEIISRMAQKNKNIRVIHNKKNTGFTGVITKSLFEAKKDLVFLAPADGQFNFKQFPKFINAIEGYDVVTAYRVKNEEPLSRKFQSRIYHLLSRFLFGIKLKEFSSVSLWKTKVFRGMKIQAQPKSNNALPEIIYKVQKKGFTFNQVPIVWNKRKGGAAKGVPNLALAISTVIEMIKLYKDIKNAPSKSTV